MSSEERRRDAATAARAAFVLVVLMGAIAAGGCGGGGSDRDAADTGAAGTTKETTTAEAQAETETETETETQPEPVTAAERRWLRLLTRYNERFERGYFVSGAVTHASMRRNTRLFRDCRATLRRAGDPGRLEPAAKPARRACERLERAARLLDQAIAASDPGGAVTVGTPEERIFKQSSDAAAEAAGNAYTGLLRAQEVGEEIERKLGS